MIKRYGLITSLLLSGLVGCSAEHSEALDSSATAAMSTTQTIAAAEQPVMPTSEQWLLHLQQDIAPFYMQSTAMGEPKGRFPTFRCNNGAVVDLNAICPELTAVWVQDKLGRQYTRMLSRQIYTYGVIFHMTGDKAALDAAKAGVDYLRANLLDKQGGAISYLTTEGKAGLSATQRTSQDLAYAQLGMAFYYYLTRDPAVLKDIVALKEYIFSHYRNQQNEQLLWVLADSEEQRSSQLELVAQLDQINGYMLLMLPLLPEVQAAKWKQDLRWLITSLLTHYHDEKEQRFYGYIHHPSGKSPGGRHADRGHTIKAYWMLYLSARVLDDEKLAMQAEAGMRAVLKRAYDQAHLYELMTDTRGMDPELEVGFWNAHPNQIGSAWWEYAELDQAAETLAFSDPSMTQYLRYTYASWMTSMVDRQYGGILGYSFAYDSPKLHHWKNGYHGAEHALIGYLGATQREGKAASLYFATQQAEPQHSYSPYYFSAGKGVVTPVNGVQKVDFSAIY